MKRTQVNPVVLPENSNSVKYIGYADDINIFIVNESLYRRSKMILERFCQYTGMVVNNGKCAICNESKSLINSNIETQYPIVPKIKILGIWFGESSEKDILNKMLKSIKEEIGKWEQLWLYMPERITIIKSVYIGRIMYFMYSLNLTKSTFKLIEYEIYRYFWQCKYEIKSRDTVRNNINKGGGVYLICFPSHCLYSYH